MIRALANLSILVLSTLAALFGAEFVMERVQPGQVKTTSALMAHAAKLRIDDASVMPLVTAAYWRAPAPGRSAVSRR